MMVRCETVSASDIPRRALGGRELLRYQRARGHWLWRRFPTSKVWDGLATPVGAFGTDRRNGGRPRPRETRQAAPGARWSQAGLSSDGRQKWVPFIWVRFVKKVVVFRTPRSRKTPIPIKKRGFPVFAAAVIWVRFGKRAYMIFAPWRPPQHGHDMLHQRLLQRPRRRPRAGGLEGVVAVGLDLFRRQCFGISRPHGCLFVARWSFAAPRRTAGVGPAVRFDAGDRI